MESEARYATRPAVVVERLTLTPQGQVHMRDHLCRHFVSMLSLRHYLCMAGTESGLNETSLRRRLKRETAAAHQHLEAQLGLLDPSLDVHRYRRVLETFYGFYVPSRST